MGVLCHEHAGTVRHWHPDEVRMAGEAADQMAHALLNAQREQGRLDLAKAKERAELLYRLVPSAIFAVGLTASFCNQFQAMPGF